jgi:hemolysin III
LSHSFENPKLRHFFRMLDQVCIFLLIAGNFTPFALSYFLEGWLWSLCILMWGGAIVGIFFKVFFRRLKNVAVSAYVVLAWIPIMAIKPMTARLPAMALFWILAGGLMSVGTCFSQRRQGPLFSRRLASLRDRREHLPLCGGDQLHAPLAVTCPPVRG